MRKLIVLALVAGLLLFGCADSGSGGQAQTQATAQSQSQGQGQATVQAQQGGGSGFEGMGYSALIASGLPVQCTVRMTSGGQASTSQMFFSGGKVRIDSSTTVEGQLFEGSAVVKDDVVYTRMSTMMQVGPYAHCDWLSMRISEMQPSEGSADVKQYDQLPPTDFSCSPWVPDESKFATPGKVCAPEIVGMIGGEMPSMPAGLELCEGLEGQALMDCVQAAQGA